MLFRRHGIEALKIFCTWLCSSWLASSTTDITKYASIPLRDRPVIRTDLGMRVVSRKLPVWISSEKKNLYTQKCYLFLLFQWIIVRQISSKFKGVHIFIFSWMFRFWGGWMGQHKSVRIIGRSDPYVVFCAHLCQLHGGLICATFCLSVTGPKFRLDQKSDWIIIQYSTNIYCSMICYYPSWSILLVWVIFANSQLISISKLYSFLMVMAIGRGLLL